MRQSINIPFVMLLMFMIAGCKPIVYTTDKWPEQYISAGSYGGFSNLTTTLYLLPNGQIFHENSFDKVKTEGKSIHQKQAKYLFHLFDSIEFSKLQNRNPGNMSYFLRQTSGNEHFTIIWGGSGIQPPKSIAHLVNVLQEILPEKPWPELETTVLEK